jgi:hypothetical protein
LSESLAIMPYSGPKEPTPKPRPGKFGRFMVPPLGSALMPLNLLF